MNSVITIGGATEDVYILTDKETIISLKDRTKKLSFISFPHPSKIVVDTIFTQSGGGATNTAVAFARLGVSVAIIAKFGEDFTGERIKKELFKENVDISFVSSTSDAQTGYSVVFLAEDGERSILTFRGANNLLSEKDVPWEILKEAPPEWFYITSLSGKSSSILPLLVDFAFSHKVKVALNPGSYQLSLGVNGVADILQKIELLILNKEEALTLCGREQDKPINLLYTLKASGPKIVVITDGDRGSIVLSDNSEPTKVGIYPPPEGVRDALGAGDAYGATFVAYLMKTGGDIEYSMNAASANAASVVSSPGAKLGLLRSESIEQCVANYKNESGESRRIFGTNAKP